MQGPPASIPRAGPGATQLCGRYFGAQGPLGSAQVARHDVLPNGATAGMAAREEALADPATISAAAQRAGGPSDAELDALHEQFTKEALAAGVFGAPSFVLPSGEIFWGQDRLELLERALKKLA